MNMSLRMTVKAREWDVLISCKSRLRQVTGTMAQRDLTQTVIIVPVHKTAATLTH